MHSRKKIPTSPNFARAQQAAYALLVECGAHTLPIDPLALIKSLDLPIHALSYQELRANTDCADPLNLRKEHVEAKTLKLRGSSPYMIVYDAESPERRLRWTIAHELGHILLGHLTEYEDTALHLGGLSESAYQVLEVEAHWFAGILLAPHALLAAYGITDRWDIERLCHISDEAARKCASYVRRTSKLRSREEQLIIRNFYRFFGDHQAPRLLPQPQCIADGRYADYMLFVHWGYVLHNLLRERAHHALYHALFDSQALIDGSSLVILCTQEHQPLVQANTTVLISTIRRFALIQIQQIDCIALQ